MNSPRIFTHLFLEGVIVASKKVDYDPDSDAEVVKGLMQAQHKAVLRELKHGAYDQKIQGLFGDSATPAPVVADPTVKAPMAEPAVDDDEEEYAQLIVDDSNVLMMAGTLDAKEEEDEIDVSGAFRRMSSEPRQPTPNPVTVSPAASAPRTQGTWMLTRTGQQERPFDKTGPIPAPVPTPVPTTIPPPIPMARSSADVRRRSSTPVTPAPPTKLPEVPTPPPPPLVQRAKRNIPPSGPLPSPEVRRPPPPPVIPSGTVSRASTSPILPVVPPAPRAPAMAHPRTTKPADSIVVARPAVVIGAPTNQERKPARESTPPPESIFGQDLISEKSLDEVIMAYLSEDANDD